MSPGSRAREGRGREQPRSRRPTPALPCDPVKRIWILCLLVTVGATITSPARADGDVVFVGDYEDGSFHQWTHCQNRQFSARCTDYDGSFYGAQIVSDDVRQGRYAARYEVRDGDAPGWSVGERAEVAASAGAKVREGDTRRYEFSLKFDQNFPAVGGDFFLVMQWHAGHGSPPMALAVNPTGQLVLDGYVGKSPAMVIGDIARGEWVDYVVTVKFSQSASTGWAEVYRNGVLAVARHSRSNMADGASYLKMGLYRSRSEQSTAVMWQDGLRVLAG
jgi:Polysaccharide lyase